MSKFERRVMEEPIKSSEFISFVVRKVYGGLSEHFVR